MKVTSLLKQYQEQAKPHYLRFFKTWQKQAGDIGDLPNQMAAKFIDLYPRGKQARGALSVLGYQLAGGKKKAQMFKASVTLELLETSVLILDDIFDQDDMRRGVPTIHKQWEAQIINTKKKQSPKNLHPTPSTLYAKYGTDLAATTSLIGHHLAPLALLETTFADNLKLSALQFYLKSTIYTGWGEALDISSPWLPPKQKQHSAAMIHYYKTIWYSAILPLSFGALLAGKPESSKFMKQLKDYAFQLGSIFQIQDDIIGSFGDPAKSGKDTTSDIKYSRWTFLIEILFKHLSAQEKKATQKILAQSELSAPEVTHIKQLMQTHDVVKKAQAQAQKHHHQGQKIILKLTKNPDHQDTLENLLEFMLQRNK